MRAILALLTLTVLCGLAHGKELPNAPSTSRTPGMHYEQGTGWVVDNNAHVIDRTFILVTGISLFSGLYDAEMTHQGLAGRGGCIESNDALAPRPSRGALYKDNLIPWAAINTMNYVFRRFNVPGSRLILIGTNAYSSAVHLRGGTLWITRGCF